ncbi:hypothetical protein Hanom_Chr12g01133201 [Helianthus anomalus]
MLLGEQLFWCFTSFIFPLPVLRWDHFLYLLEHISRNQKPFPSCVKTVSANPNVMKTGSMVELVGSAGPDSKLLIAGREKNLTMRPSKRLMISTLILGSSTIS